MGVCRNLCCSTHRRWSSDPGDPCTASRAARWIELGRRGEAKEAGKDKGKVHCDFLIRFISCVLLCIRQNSAVQHAWTSEAVTERCCSTNRRLSAKRTVRRGDKQSLPFSTEAITAQIDPLYIAIACLGVVYLCNISTLCCPVLRKTLSASDWPGSACDSGV